MDRVTGAHLNRSGAQYHAVGKAAIVRLLQRPPVTAAWLLIPMGLLAAGADARPGLRPAEIAARTRPAVVFISADTPAGESVGSGFIVDLMGTVVTNLHVVEGATAIRVKLASGLAYDHVRVRAVDDRTDLAILQLAGFGLPSLALGDSDSLRPGDPVVLLGNPRGREGGVSSGTVRGMRTTESGLRVIEMDATADGGSSGGPLLAIDGRVVGVLSFKLKGARRSKFAIPINYARRLISSAPASPK
jgi:serine protease Do